MFSLEELNNKITQLNDDKFYMDIALSLAKYSDDPSTQVGAIIVNIATGKILSWGVNHMPKSAPDGTYNLQNNSTSNPNDEKWLETKYPYIIHAEMNCLLNANTTKLNGHKMYVTLASCNDCAKNLSQTGIEEVIYWSDKYKNKPSFIAGKKIFKNSNIKNYQFFYISPLLNEVE